MCEPTQSELDHTAAYRHVDATPPDHVYGGGYLWYGHNLRTAFLRGIEYGRDNPIIESEQSNDRLHQPNQRRT